MDKWEDDIRRYQAGEMSPQEQHALERKALSDPFLYEALEGTTPIDGVSFKNDLKDIELKINNRITEQGSAFGMAGAASATAYTKRAKEADVEVAPKEKRKRVWPFRIAASIILIIAFYFALTPLLKNKEHQLAQKTVEAEKNQVEQEAVVTDSTTKHSDQLALAKDSKPPVTENKKSKKEVTPVPEKIEDKSESGSMIAAAPVEKDLSREEKAAEKEVTQLISESPKVAAAEEKQADIKMPSSQVSRSKAASGIASNQKIIKGKVLSADDGIPLPGVNIVVKGTTTGTVTDMQGNYQIITQSQNPTLVYSFIGLQTAEVKATDQTELNVNLQTDVSQLSEVVVTGYSPTKADLDREPIIKLAEPEGGRRAYDKYLKTNLQYPQQALDNKIKGRVTIQFTVSTDGSLSDFSVYKGLGYGCDEEVIRMVKEGPKWSPTTEDNVAVESEVRVRVKFALPN